MFQVSASRENWIKAVKADLQEQQNKLQTTRNIAYRFGNTLSLITELHKENLRLKAALDRLLTLFVDEPVAEGVTFTDCEQREAEVAKRLLAVEDGDVGAAPDIDKL